MPNFTRPGSSRAPSWRKSSWSSYNGECIEVGLVRDRVVVRDSKRPEQGVVAYSASHWRSFLAQVKHGSSADQLL
jgi:hypothetical protein